MQKTFFHPLFGFVCVSAGPGGVYIPARGLARRLGFLRVSRALKASGAVPGYAMRGGRVPLGTEIEAHDVWRLTLYAEKRRRRLPAGKMYDWVYDGIMPWIRRGGATCRE